MSDDWTDAPEPQGEVFDPIWLEWERRGQGLRSADVPVDEEGPTRADWLRWIGVPEETEPMDDEAEEHAKDMARTRRLRRMMTLIDAYLAGPVSDPLRLKLISVRNQLESELASIVRKWD